MAEETIKLPGEPKNVVMRFAPNPNGPLTIGHARGVVVNSYLVGKYGGKLILRFDDTDPKTKKPMPEAYGWILEDVKWLGAEPDEVAYCSDDIDVYYKHAEELVTIGGAYACNCTQDEFKGLKDNKQCCPHREAAAEENLKLWKEMLSGKHEEKSYVLRIKTDIECEDPALRDWVAFRIVKDEHPRTGKKYCVWPMLDFAGAIEDHIIGTTHIIRGKDLMDSEKRQKFVYHYFNWTYPETLHWGRIRLEEFGKLSTSQMRKDIEEGKYSGWDDIALPTLKALRRRGIRPEAIREFMLSLGLSETDISMTMENMYSVNRQMIDAECSRYFFIEDPTPILIEGMPCKTVRMALHPAHKDKGVRQWTLCEDNKLYVSRKDANSLNHGEIVKLIGLYFIEVLGVGDAVKAKFTRKEDKKAKKIQCLQEHMECEIIKPDGKAIGICEPDAKNISVGETIQFERYCFARLEKKDGKQLSFAYTHG
ncbi:MAG: glutamate--tRNA ligase [Candidatus Altiarchaeota archaeon]|nr:glutamate--tRNA ligase [Candidatus Altiarchaeota archaeon]